MACPQAAKSVFPVLTTGAQEYTSERIAQGLQAAPSMNRLVRVQNVDLKPANVHIRQGTLVARPFDIGRGELTGDFVTVAGSVN